MHAALRPYVTTGVALVAVGAIAVTPIAATPPDVKIANPAVQLTASPFDPYEVLFTKSVDNIAGLIELALAPPPPPSELPFTVDAIISQTLDVEANIAAFQELVSGLPAQLQGSVQFSQMFLQAASNALQAGNLELAIGNLLFGALFVGGGLAEQVVSLPLTFLGADVALAAPELFGAALTSAVAPALSGVAASGQVAQDVLDALKAGNPQEVVGDLLAAPAVVTNAVLNGTQLQTSIFGTVDIPGILTDTTLQEQSGPGPGPISLAIQLVQLTRTLLAPPTAAASSLNSTQDTARATTFDLNVNQGVQRRAVASGTEKPTATADPETKGTGNVAKADKVTNAGTGDSDDVKKDHPRLLGGNSGSPLGDGQGAKNLSDGINDGIQGFREGVRNVVKSLTGRGGDDKTETDAANDGP